MIQRLINIVTGLQEGLSRVNFIEQWDATINLLNYLHYRFVETDKGRLLKKFVGAVFIASLFAFMFAGMVAAIGSVAGAIAIWIAVGLILWLVIVAISWMI